MITTVIKATAEQATYHVLGIHHRQRNNEISSARPQGPVVVKLRYHHLLQNANIQDSCYETSTVAIAADINNLRDTISAPYALVIHARLLGQKYFEVRAPYPRIP